MSEIWGEWIEWKGGECHHLSERVQVQYKNGEVHVLSSSIQAEWTNADEEDDIVRYRRLLANEVREAAAKSPALNTDRAQLMSLAEEASSIVNGDRRTDYGKPERNFERIAHLWTGLARAKGWAVTFEASDISPFLRQLKEARIIENPTHRDSFVDLIGYTLTGAEVNGVR